MLDHDGGSVPVRLFLERSKPCRCVMLDHDEGSGPARLLLERSNCCSCVMLDHDGGSVPEMPLLCSWMDVTFKPLQLMPCQSHMGTDGSPHPLLLNHRVVVV